MDEAEIRELRRSYHDRIAAVRAVAQEVLDAAVSGTEAVTTAFVATGAMGRQIPGMEGAAALVDAEVVDMIALQAPVGRDLRIVLAARDVATIGLLCVNLCRTAAGRVASAAAVLTPGLLSTVGNVGAATTAVLRGAAGAWAGMDQILAGEVEADAGQARLLHLDLLAELVGLSGVPMESALDLGMAARAFERLTDHAVEVAERVLFVAGGADFRP